MGDSMKKWEDLSLSKETKGIELGIHYSNKRPGEIEEQLALHFPQEEGLSEGYIFKEKELKKQGFILVHKGKQKINNKYVHDETSYRYSRGVISIVVWSGFETVYIHSRITFNEDFARPALGIKTMKDLINLCRLVNGD